jgi:hypothetical protein
LGNPCAALRDLAGKGLVFFPGSPQTAVRWLVVVNFFLLIGAFGEASSQTEAVEEGSRLRVSSEAYGVRDLVGLLSRIHPDTIQVGSTTMAVDWISRVDISRGQSTKLWQGRGIGFLAGGLIGGGIGTIACWPCDGEFDVYSPALGAGAGMVLGLLVGGQRGFSRKSDNWEEIPKERLRIVLSPRSRGGFLLQVSVRYRVNSPKRK